MVVIPVVLFATLLLPVHSSITATVTPTSLFTPTALISSFSSGLPKFESTAYWPDASSLSVGSHRTSLVSPTRSVTVQTSVVTGQTSVVIGQTSTVTGQTSIITSQTSAVTVQTSVVTGQTSTVSGQTNTVTVQTSAVTGQSNTVTGQTSTVNGQTSTVSGQTSTVAVQTSIVAGQTSIVSGQSSTVTDQANTVSGQTSTIDVSPTRTSPGISASVPTDVNPCKRNNGGCAHYCTRLNREYNCSCSSGFKLNADRHTCTEINECNSTTNKHKCAHICVNTVGSYACACRTGHKLEMDGLTCKEVTTSSPPEAAQSHYWGWVVFGVAVALVLLSIVMLILGVISKRVMNNRKRREISGVRELTELSTTHPVAEPSPVEIEP
ncbi:autotransporter adhesin BpaC [Pocillopora verrucosa]|uniref:autotransporter adhesin BpaC n=1 Tax=Pocillopora verrucosa TaxID=203993 RepID=UPI00333F1170